MGMVTCECSQSPNKALTNLMFIALSIDKMGYLCNDTNSFISALQIGRHRKIVCSEGYNSAIQFFRGFT